MRASALAGLAMVAALCCAPDAGAKIIVEDNFDSYAAGANIGGPSWNPKWQSGSDQQNLFTASASGGYAVLDTSVAQRNYHVPNQTGFSVKAGERVFISTDFQYSYAGGGNITTNFNQNAFGLMVTDQPQWWNGSSKHFTLANRGAAIGNTLSVSPWIEGWQTHSKLGVNTANAELSEWINIEWELYPSGGTVWGRATFTDDQGAQTGSYTSTPIDLGYSVGETLYAGYSTDWNGVGAVSIESFSSIDAVHFDNFSITAIPEPGAVLLGTLLAGALGVAINSRKRDDA